MPANAFPAAGQVASSLDAVTPLEKVGGQDSCANPKPQRLRDHRLRKNAQFRTVYENGQKLQTANFVAFCYRRKLASVVGKAPAATSGQNAAPAPGPFIGFTLPRAVGKAVVRNRIRRRLRELVQARLDAISPLWEIVINPRRKALLAPQEQLRRDVEQLVQRCSK